jgi:hypothetical protein
MSSDSLIHLPPIRVSLLFISNVILLHRLYASLFKLWMIGIQGYRWLRETHWVGGRFWVRGGGRGGWMVRGFCRRRGGFGCLLDGGVGVGRRLVRDWRERWDWGGIEMDKE